MKKVVLYLLVGVMALGLMACGGKTQTDQSSQAAGESIADGTLPTDEGMTAVGEEDLAEEAVEMDLEAVKIAIVEAVGVDNYFPDMTLDAEMLESITGITSDLYDEFIGEMPMISTNVDTLLIIKAKEGKVEAVQEALNAYREANVNSAMQYPMNVGKIQASRIETFGNYVCFVQLGGDTATALESGDEAVLEQCLQVNELVLEIIGQNTH